MITVQNVKDICVDIVRAWPYNETDALNTFAVLRKGSDWGANNFNKSPLDIRANDYYVRNLQDGVRESGYLTMEHRKYVANGFFSKSLDLDLWFTVAYDIDCEDCPDHEKKSAHQLFDLSVTTMRQFIEELGNFRVYEIDGGPLEIWASPLGIADVVTANAYSTSAETGKSIRSYVRNQNDDIDIFEQNLSQYGMVGCSINLMIKSCQAVSVPAFKYGTSDPDNPGVVICNTCS